MSVSWEFGELRQLSADLGKADVGVTRKAGEVVRKSASDVEAQAKARAAVDTGAMRNSIGVRMAGPLSAEIGPTVHYAQYVEFGTYKMAAQPFMGPAADAVAPSFIAAMEQLGGDIL